MIVILVGSPGAGKTTLLKELQKNKINVFHTDSFINKIYRKGEIGYKLIKENFGTEFLNENNVNKEKLGNYLAKDISKIQKLNNIIFPIIKDYLEGKDNFVAELPIALNSNIKFNYDKIVLVGANDETIKERLIKSNKNIPFIQEIIKKWKKTKEINFDLKIDTTNGISKNDINNIIKLLNN